MEFTFYLTGYQSSFCMLHYLFYGSVKIDVQKNFDERLVIYNKLVSV